jgi:hypothetical protein
MLDVVVGRKDEGPSMLKVSHQECEGCTCWMCSLLLRKERGRCKYKEMIAYIQKAVVFITCGRRD